jgi:hypothetical protein
MRPAVLFALCLAVCLLPASVLAQQPAAVPAVSSSAQPVPDPAAYVAQQFGSSFKVDPKIPPLFGDLDGDGHEDLVLVATSATPLLGQQQYDPYDGYFGTGDAKITSTFTLHFDGSASDILIVFNWRQPSAPDPKHIAKFVLINTPFEKLSIPSAKMRMKGKSVQAMETVDSTSLHSLLVWDGRHWHWIAQGMDGDEPVMPRKN